MTDQGKKRKGGRPPKPVNEVRTYAVNIRLNKAEALELEKWRALAGYTQLAAYIRTAVLSQGAPPASVPEANRLKWAELARLSANLNQLTDHLNKGQRMSAGEQRMLAHLLLDTQKELKALRNALIGSKSGV